MASEAWFPVVAAPSQVGPGGIVCIDRWEIMVLIPPPTKLKNSPPTASEVMAEMGIEEVRRRYGWIPPKDMIEAIKIFSRLDRNSLSFLVSTATW